MPPKKKRTATKRTPKRALDPEVLPKMGQPTKYRKEYCQRIIEERAKGYSEMGFAGIIGVKRTTIADWAKKHPEFAEARELAACAAREFYDRVGIMGMTGKIAGFNVTAWIWIGKNCFGMRDKVEQHNTHGPLTVRFASGGSVSVGHQGLFPNSKKNED